MSDGNKKDGDKIPRAKWGPKKLRKLLDDRDDYAMESRPQAGHGTTIDRKPDGTRINADGGGDGASSEPNDFSLYIFNDTLLGIDNGYVNNILPSGMTEGAERGSDAAFVIGVSGSGKAWLHATISDGGAVTAVSISVGTSVPSNTTSAAYCVLGDFAVADGKLSSIGAGSNGIGSQGVFSCGGNHYFYAA